MTQLFLQGCLLLLKRDRHQLFIARLVATVEFIRLYFSHVLVSFINVPMGTVIVKGKYGRLFLPLFDFEWFDLYLLSSLIFFLIPNRHIFFLFPLVFNACWRFINKLRWTFIHFQQIVFRLMIGFKILDLERRGLWRWHVYWIFWLGSIFRMCLLVYHRRLTLIL